jgi:hypothetical protein
MSWRAQSRSKDAKTPSTPRGRSEKPELDLWPIQQYVLRCAEYRFRIIIKRKQKLTMAHLPSSCTRSDVSRNKNETNSSDCTFRRAPLYVDLTADAALVWSCAGVITSIGCGRLFCCSASQCLLQLVHPPANSVRSTALLAPQPFPGRPARPRRTGRTPGPGGPHPAVGKNQGSRVRGAYRGDCGWIECPNQLVGWGQPPGGARRAPRWR